MEDEILKYLTDKYNPNAIIIYGSYANKSNDENSDFDVMVITDEIHTKHDTNYIQGIQLDAYIFTSTEIEQTKDFYSFIQVFDGKIVYDERNIASKLKKNVLDYIEINSITTDTEKEDLKNWCLKMMKRTERGDIEGMYRWHWLLSDSLEIYCKIRNRFYFGPKKTIQWMKANDIEGYDLVAMALNNFNSKFLEKWIHWIIQY